MNAAPARSAARAGFAPGEIASAGDAPAGNAPAGNASDGNASDGAGPAARQRPARPGPGRSRRQRNARGQGARLTDEIVSGALALIERAGTDEAVTLRAVAREVGIAAPSIYPHFADRDAIVLAVVSRVFDQLTEAIEAGIRPAGPDPAGRLVAGCQGYVDYGLRHPARYGVLFSGRRLAAAQADGNCEPVPTGPGGRPQLELGAESFALLLDSVEACVRAGASASTDPVADATAIWVALHGTVTLRITLPGFPWPQASQFVRDLVLSLAKVTPASGPAVTAEPTG